MSSGMGTCRDGWVPGQEVEDQQDLEDQVRWWEDEEALRKAWVLPGVD